MKDSEFQQMVIAKRAFGKDRGRQYAHFIQSFSPRDQLTPEKAFEIGKQFLERLGKVEDFQVVMAVHTNEEHLHIHYIINSVSHVNGRKWQSTPQDLKQMRELSDQLCRENGLSIIEQRRHGQRSYGEYTAKTSWKQQLALDIADCLKGSKSRADFLHRMDEKGLDADFGQKSILFTVKPGMYGLKDERKCSGYKLMSYGDFSVENIRNTLRCTAELVEAGYRDTVFYRKCFLHWVISTSPATRNTTRTCTFKTLILKG